MEIQIEEHNDKMCYMFKIDLIVWKLSTFVQYSTNDSSLK